MNFEEYFAELANEDDGIVEELEDFDPSTLPASILAFDEVYDFIDALPDIRPGVPPRFFKIGFMSDFTGYVQSQYRGGKGSTPESPNVKIIKCTEFSQIYTGSLYQNTKDTRNADKEIGDARHTGPTNSWNYQGPGCIRDKIGHYASNPERLALRAYIPHGCKITTRFYISINGAAFTEASREEVAQYLTPKKAEGVLHPIDPRTATALTPGASGAPINDTPVNTFYLDKLYMIGNLGHSIF